VRRRNRDAEHAIETGSACEPSEEREADEHRGKGHEQPLAHVMQAEVPELVSEHRFDLRRSQLVEQGIEEHDALVSADAGEVSIAMRRPAGAIDDEDTARAE